jgi:hypothetical protein
MSENVCTKSYEARLVAEMEKYQIGVKKLCFNETHESVEHRTRNEKVAKNLIRV